MKPLWLSDAEAWNELPLSERLEHLRKHYCTGPCGQSVSVQVTREVTDTALKQAIELISAFDELTHYKT